MLDHTTLHMYNVACFSNLDAVCVGELAGVNEPIDDIGMHVCKAASLGALEACSSGGVG